MRPSFFTLFKRGKYFHSSPPRIENGNKILRVRGNTREAERFAASAVAFAWQHDRALREHFWQTICQFPGDPALTRGVHISVEPEDWADLLIINREGKRRFVYVVECKINAPLEEHQDPSRRAFGSVGGYGRFLTESDRRAGTEFRFIVLRLTAPLDLARVPWSLPLLVQQRSWEEFAANFPKTIFARDLALSLGKLGVGAFPASETRNMKIDTNKSDIGKAIRTLADLQERQLEWPSGRGSSANFYQEEAGWFLGVELNRAEKSKNSASLKKLVTSPGRGQAWIGYEGEEGEEYTKLAVYIYCDSAPGQKKIADRLREKLSGKLSDFRLKEEAPDGKYYNVSIRGRSHKLPSDVAWFSAVFHALGFTLAGQ